MNDHTKYLGTEPIYRLLLRFSIPSVIGLLVQALYNVVDRIFVGQGIGALGLAGITLSFPLMMTQIAFCLLFGSGAAALISLNLGKRRKERAEWVLGNALLLTLVVSLLFALAGFFFADEMLTLFMTSDTAHPYAVRYLSIVFLGSPFMFLSFVCNFMIRAEGSPRLSMLMLIAGAMVNVILDPLLIFVFKLGIAGAAWATVSGEFISVLIGLYYYFLSGRNILQVKLRYFKLNLKIIRPMLAIGFAPFIMNLAGSLQNGLFNRQLLVYGGDVAVAALGIIFSVCMIMLMLVFGISDGLQPIVGYNYGAENYQRVKQALLGAGLSAMAIVTAGTLCLEIFPGIAIRLFCAHDPTLMAAATKAMRIVIILFPIVAIQIIGTRYFQAIGKAGIATFLGLSRQVLIFIPVLFFMSYEWHLTGVWFSSPTADLFAAILTISFLVFEIGKLKKSHAETTLRKS